MPPGSDRRGHRGAKNQIDAGPPRAGAVPWERTGGAGERAPARKQMHAAARFSPAAERIAARRVREPLVKAQHENGSVSPRSPAPVP